jgi:hypothetical protein
VSYFASAASRAKEAYDLVQGELLFAEDDRFEAEYQLDIMRRAAGQVLASSTLVISNCAAKRR